MSLAARIGRAIFWSQAGRVAEAAIWFLFYLFLARALGPADYGEFALGMSLAAVCGFLALLGLGPETLGRFLPEIAARGGRRGVRRLLGVLFAIRGAAVFVLCGAVWLFRRRLLERFHFALLPASLLLVLLVFAARSAFDLLTYYCSGLLDLRRVAFAKLAASFVAPGVFVIFWSRHLAGVQAAWLAAGAGAVAGGAILSVPFLARGVAGTAARSMSLPIGRILAFGVFAWATNLFLYVLGDSMDVLLLGWLRPQREEVGYYAVGAKVVLSLSSLLIAWASLASVAVCSEALQQGGIRKLAQTAEAQWKLGVLCLIPPLAFLIRFARNIVTAFYSPAYAASVPVVEILAALMIGAAIAGSSVQAGVLYALNRERVACALVGGAAVFNFVSEVILVRRFGIDGAAVATGLSMLLSAILCAAASRRYAPIHFPFRFVAKIMAATALALAGSAWLNPVSLIALLACCAIFAGVFFASLTVLKPLTGEDTAAIQQIHRGLGGWAEKMLATASAASGAR